MPQINEIIKLMTLEEKAALCTGTSAWDTLSIERLGVPVMTVSDGPHGLRHEEPGKAWGAKALPATCFPTASCSGSTWNLDLMSEMGNALAEECIAQKVDVILGPGVNMKRTPVCGRNFEYLSEDPFLAGEMAASLVNAIQSKGVGTSLKHFAANSQEYRRHSISAYIDERTLREIYLPAFETVVKKAGPWTVMCAYNKVNGTYCSENHKLLDDILKKEWGFEGLVVSDWGAVHDRVASLKGGIDLEMPGPKELRVKAVVEAVRSGVLDESMLDESVRRILGVVFKAAATPKGGQLNVEAHHALARRIAAEGMVLLKNNGVLPLKNPQHIAVIGQAAKIPHFEGGGSSQVNPTQVDIPFDELKKLAGDVELNYSQGYPADSSFQQGLIDEAVLSAKSAEVALIFVALPETKESEGYDRKDLDLTPQQVALINAVASVQPATVVILNNGAPVVMSDWIDPTAAVLEAWMMGQAGGGAIADLLYGKVNPSGKLTETFPLKLADTPASINYPGANGEVRYGEGIFIGYRYYDAKGMPVLFPFGYGGSYTTFAYSSPKVSTAQFKDVDGLMISVDVTNTGKVAGKEVVQFYVHDHKANLIRPPKELKGFAKVELQPGETKTVTVHLDFRAFAFYHPGYQRWITETGEFDILIGASAADIRCSQTVGLQSTLELPCILNRESSIRDWLNDPRGRLVITQLVQERFAQFASLLKEDDLQCKLLEIEPTDLLDNPLLTSLDFREQDLPMPADHLVNALLKQVYSSKN
jgi:beta-glucosidase